MRASGLPQLLPTERPRCPRCRERMDLQRLDPGMRGVENRVSEVTAALRRLTLVN
jgi:tRNA(Ile2) C34 agmatinyltransferase TiaS